MSVVTISRGSFSGGKLIAECLASDLGFRCIDRDVIVERAAAAGVSQYELRDALEKPPSFLERFGHRKYLYLALIQAALTEEVRTGKVVYHGNAGHLLLKGAKSVLRIRVIAPLEMRIRMCRERLRIGTDEAIHHIKKMDDDRRKWAHYLYGVDPHDPALYDLVLNLESIDVSEACTLLAGFVRGQKCFSFGPSCREALDDLALASRVKADLAIDAATSDLEVDVAAKSGAVRIRGSLNTPQQLREVERVARAVAGVASLDLDGLG
ncbi:MAG: cytidylate kinase family protein [Acidobacteria bacterium]|nr:cytidylate kinase family protein [Acidobacteriota bacterium]